MLVFSIHRISIAFVFERSTYSWIIELYVWFVNVNINKEAIFIYSFEESIIHLEKKYFSFSGDLVNRKQTIGE